MQTWAFERKVELLTQHEAAMLLHKRPRVLRFWRTAGIGLAYVKLGKTILYHQKDLIAYIQGQHCSTFRASRDSRRKNQNVALYKRRRIGITSSRLMEIVIADRPSRSPRLGARQIEVRKMQKVQENRYAPFRGKPPILRDFATAKLKRLDNSSLDPETKRYYRNGWNRLKTRSRAGIRLDWTTTEAVEALQLEGSPSWHNQMLRTLSVILGKAIKHRYLYRKPKIKLKKEGRWERSSMTRPRNYCGR